MPSTPRVSVPVLQSVALVVLCSSLAYGQSFTATVRGTVKDPSGSSVPHASVTMTDADRGTTSGDGRPTTPADS